MWEKSSHIQPQSPEEEDHKTLFISATVHYISDEFELVSRVLFVAPFEDNVFKAGENISKTAVHETPRIWIRCLIALYQSGFVTECGANVVAALQGYMGLNCNDYILNMILSSAFANRVLEKTTELADLQTSAK